MSESNSSKFILNSKIVKLIRQSWRDIIRVVEFIVIGLIGLYLAWREVDIAKRQLLYEQMQQTTLEYSYQWGFSQTDQKAILETADRLMKDYSEQVYKQEQANPNLTYPQILSIILPMTATVHVQPVSILILINNTGTTTARQVRAFFRMDHPITDYEAKSLEPFKIIDGGIGEHEVAIEIDRIAAGHTVGIKVVPEDTAFKPQLQEIGLYMPDPDEQPYLSPILKLTSPQEPGTGVNITFGEGVATLHQKDLEARRRYLPMTFVCNTVHEGTVVKKGTVVKTSCELRWDSYMTIHVLPLSQP